MSDICSELERSSVVDVMKKLHEESEKRRVELGFAICEKDGKLTVGAICTGSECEIIIKDCKNGKIIGKFHTHPGARSMVSPEDAMNVLKSELKVFCVSGVDGVKCYVPDEKIYVDDRAWEEARDLVEKFRSASYSLYSLIVRGFMGKLEPEDRKLKKELEKEVKELEKRIVKKLFKDVCEF